MGMIIGDVSGLTLTERFRRYLEEERSAGRFSEKMYRESMTLSRKLERFLAVRGCPGIGPADFTPEHLADFESFCIDEYLYAADPRYAALYPRTYPASCRYPRRPLRESSQRKLLNHFRTFWRDLVSFGEIPASPCGAVPEEETRHGRCTELLGDPVSLTREEFRQLLAAPVPERLADVRNRFLLQVCLGLGSRDFRRLGLQDLAVSPDGIPYFCCKAGLRIPLVRTAFDILLRTRLRFPFTGDAAFNRGLRQYLRDAGLLREVCVYDSRTGRSVSRPLCDVYSAENIHRTHMDLQREAAAQRGLRGARYSGTQALRRMQQPSLADEQRRLSEVFGQPLFRTDDNLNIREGAPFLARDPLIYAEQPEKLPGGRTNPYVIARLFPGDGQLALCYGPALSCERKLLVCGSRFPDFLAGLPDGHRRSILYGLLLLKILPDIGLPFLEDCGRSLFCLRTLLRGAGYATFFYRNGDSLVLLDVASVKNLPPVEAMQRLRWQHVTGEASSADYDPVLDACFGPAGTPRREWAATQACSAYVGQTLREARKAAGLRQEALLAQWGLKTDCGNLADAENGARVLPFKYLGRYLAALGLSASLVRPALDGWNAFSRSHTLAQLRRAAGENA